MTDIDVDFARLMQLGEVFAGPDDNPKRVRVDLAWTDSLVGDGWEWYCWGVDDVLSEAVIKCLRNYEQGKVVTALGDDAKERQAAAQWLEARIARDG